jgi:hypothetical protein
MTLTILMDSTPAQAHMLAGLARLRATFPLEERMQHAAPQARAAYARILSQWLRGTPPLPTAFNPDTLAMLMKLDAVSPDEPLLGCYPFSTIDTGIHVTLPGGTVNAMCAIDALAIARLARTRTHIDARCMTCGANIALEVEENGSLDHDQVELARVIWQHAEVVQTSCSQGLCRRIRFLCGTCPKPDAGEHFTLPQAAAIGNAFFRFQSALLTAQTESPTSR